jgi:hypothetical protein
VVATTITRTPSFGVATVSTFWLFTVPLSTTCSFINISRHRSCRHLRPGLSSDSGGTVVWHAPAAAQDAPEPEGCALVCSQCRLLVTASSHNLSQVPQVISKHWHLSGSIGPEMMMCSARRPEMFLVVPGLLSEFVRPSIQYQLSHQTKSCMRVVIRVRVRVCESDGL